MGVLGVATERPSGITHPFSIEHLAENTSPCNGRSFPCQIRGTGPVGSAVKGTNAEFQDKYINSIFSG